MDNAQQLLDLIKNIVTDAISKTDSSCVCYINSKNEDGTYNVFLLPDMSTVIRNIRNESKYEFEQGDYALLYKIRGQVSNSFIMARWG